MRPPSHLHATLKPPSCDPQATFMRPPSHLHAIPKPGEALANSNPKEIGLGVARLRWSPAPPFDFRGFRQALRPEGGAEVHFGDFVEAVRALAGGDFLGRGIHGRRGAFGQSCAE